MKKKKFLKQLRHWCVSQGMQWEIKDRDGRLRIRTVDPYARLCPLTALACQRKSILFPLNMYASAAKELGISKRLARDIVRASDDLNNHDPHLRLAIMDALGIGKPEESKA